MKRKMLAGLSRFLLATVMLVMLVMLVVVPRNSIIAAESIPNPSATAPADTPTTDAQPPATKPLPKYVHPDAAPAQVQNIGRWGMICDFLRIGFTHILPNGLDHILFVLGLFLLSPKLKPLLIQVTAFTIAHSITLGLCMAEVVKLPSQVVEPLIAASIVFVAIENIIYKELKPWRWIVVFCFGLIHGLGFAGSLNELGLPEGTFFLSLISFNIGVEVGQLSVIAMATMVTVWFWKKPWYRARITIPASVIIAAVGFYWAVQRIWSSLA